MHQYTNRAARRPPAWWLYCNLLLTLLEFGSLGCTTPSGSVSDGEDAAQPTAAADANVDQTAYTAADSGTTQSDPLINESADTETPLSTENKTDAGLPLQSAESVAPDLPAVTCTSPLQLYTLENATIVGDGTPESCTAEALQQAITENSAVRFECGPEATTIAVQETLIVPADRDTFLDGEGRVTLDGTDQARILELRGSGWRTNPHKLVLQRLTLRNARAPGGEYFPPKNNPDCAYGYKEGSGGAVLVRDGGLEVIDSVFENNHAASPGPDVGGGAIYALGSSHVTISGSVFKDNDGANGGAVGALYASVEVYNSSFVGNRALGLGMNFRVNNDVLPEAERCPAFNHEGQGGAGGLAGALYVDGPDEDHELVICGTRFEDNRANEMGGALFRTPNRSYDRLRLDRCAFIDNAANLGGVSFIKDNDVTVRATLFAGNRGAEWVDGSAGDGDVGGLWVNRGTVDIENTTFEDHLPNGLVVDNRTTPGDDRPASAGPERPGTTTNVTFVSSPVVGSLTSHNNLFVEQTCSLALPGTNNLQWPEGEPCAEGLSFADPELAPLADNGGPTQTRLPQATEAVQVGSDCPATDQRGLARAGCAAGAAEPQ